MYFRFYTPSHTQNYDVKSSLPPWSAVKNVCKIVMGPINNFRNAVPLSLLLFWQFSVIRVSPAFPKFALLLQMA